MQSDTSLGLLAGGALAVGVPVTLRQLDVIKRLPDVPWRGFDANQVTTSPEAYPIAGIPDGIAACALYVTEIALVAARKRRKSKWIDRALAACVFGGAAAAIYYGYEMVFVEKKVCVYCTAALALNLAMVPFGWRVLRGRR